MNKIYTGNFNINKAYLGGDLTIRIYLGDNLVYPIEPHDYSQDYLTIESQANNNQISFSNNIQYSVDNGSTWTTLATGNTVSLNSGDTAMFKASGITPTGADGIGHFSSTDSYKVYGNVMSLVYGDNFSGQTTMSNYQFIGLFCTSTVLQDSGLTDASNLVLPATTLTDFCYFRMFENCVNLTAAPELSSTSLDFACYAQMFQGCSSLLAAPSLPATTLANECYDDMFFGCSSLTAAPQLPATTLAERCYSGMFANCSGLTSAPALSATTLANQCYEAMFQNCSGLTSAPVLPATTMAASAYTYMFEGCTSLTTPPSLPATTLADWCYRSMFDRCTSLTSAPTLPATTLATACYYAMFFGCTNLTTAPDLSASTLVNRCYMDMFEGCTSLNSITCLATDISATDCTYNWVNNVASSGTFVKAESMSSWTTGVNGIPAGWVVENEGDLPYEEQYLTFVAEEDNLSIGLTNAGNNVYQYSIDSGATWSNLANSGSTSAVNSGQTIMFKASGITVNTNNGIGTLTPSVSASVQGNVMSLVYGDNFSGQTTIEYQNQFRTLFSGSYNLTSAENLILPATTLAGSCYYSMFSGCTSLTTAPELPATTLVTNCYRYMFAGCTSLNYIKCLATNISAYRCTGSWVNGVASAGTFVKAASMNDWTTNVDGIPSNWTIQNDDGSPYIDEGGGDNGRVD